MNFNKNPFLNKEVKIASNMVKATAANDSSNKIASIRESMKKAKDNGLKNNNNMSSQEKVNIIKELESMRK